MAVADYKALSQAEKIARIKAVTQANPGIGDLSKSNGSSSSSGGATTKAASPAYGSNISNFDANDEIQKKIADLGQQWAAAKGNDQLQDQLHAQANALREGGSYNSVTGIHTIGTPVQQIVAAPPQPAPQPSSQGTSQSLIDQLNAARKNQVLADLGKSRDNALSNLSGEKSAIAPKYYDQRNQVAAGAQQQARNFAEYMAARGGTSSGANAQAELSSNMSTQGNLGSLGRQEAADFSDIERRTTGVNNAFESDVASANAGIESDKMQALLSDYYTQQQRELQIAGLMGQFQGQKTLAGQQFDSNQTQQAWDNKFNYGNAIGQFGNGQQTLNKQLSDRDYNYQVGRDDVLDEQWAKQFDASVKQNGIQNALAQTRANSSGSGGSGGLSLAQKISIWKISGQAPEGIPGVTPGTKVYDEVAARNAAEKSGGVKLWDAVKGVLNKVSSGSGGTSDADISKYLNN